MTMPINILEIQLTLALLSTLCLFFINDKNNYVDTISGLVATIFWWTSGLSLLSGVSSEGVTYSGSWLMWIFVGIGVVTAFITFVKILDAINGRKDHVNMDFDYRI